MSGFATLPLELSDAPLDGVHLIEASAGTGKTYTITGLFVRLVVERGLRVSQIAAVTFTNAATEELRDRIARRVVETRESFRRAIDEGTSAFRGDPLLEAIAERVDLRRALRLLERAARELDQSSVFTIHGFAGRVLREHALDGATRLEAELSADTARLVHEAFRDFWDGRVAALDPERYRALGGSALYRELQSVAKGAMAHVDLPVVELSPSAFKDRERELDRAFRDARPLASQVDAAKRHLAGAHQSSYKPEKVAEAAEFWKAYLAAERPGLELSKDAEKWRAETVRAKGKKAGFDPSHPFFERIEPLFVALERLEEAVELLRFELRRDLVTFVRQRVEREKTRDSVQSFDDLLLELRDALRDGARGDRLAAGVARRFPAVLIDEFQDTDPVQAEIFERVFTRRSRGVLYLIGDPKQSIYSFRGADVHAYLDAHRLATGPVLTLATSYRSGPSLVKAQNLLFGGCAAPFVDEAVLYREVRSAPGRSDVLTDAEGTPVSGLAVHFLERGEGSNFAPLVARSIADHLRSGLRIDGRPLSPADIAVLTRANKGAFAVQRELLRLGVPAVVHGDRSVFEADEALELRRILLALAEPRSPRLLRAALATRFLGVTAADFVRFADDPRELEEWAARFVGAGALWNERGIAFALTEIERTSGLLVRTLREPDGERRMTNYRHLFELLHEAEQTEHLGPASLVRFLEVAIADPMGHGMAPEARQVRLESDAEAVTLTTIHRSKGLEYGLVFLPDLHEVGRSRFEQNVFRTRLDEGTFLDVRGKSSEHWEAAVRAEEAEGMRLLYVALTRAKHRTVLLYPPRAKEGAGRVDVPFDALAYLVHSNGPGKGTSLGAYLAALSVADERRRWLMLAEASEGSIEIARLGGEEARWVPPDEGASALVARELPRIVTATRRVSSFSGLTRNATVLSRAEREGRDIDESVPALVADEGVRGDERVLLADYPRGAGPGEALHSIFERSFLAEADDYERARIVVEELLRHGLGDTDRDAVRAGIGAAFRTPLFPGGFSLAELRRASVFPEMEFSFPIARAGSLLSADRLALALGHGATSTLPASYLREVARLPFSAMGGFLRGFIDLVCEVSGRFYVLDYKSNFLGETYADYRGPALERSMAEHHYYLQAALYSVAVHRYLAARLEDYDYDRHFGGVHYLFVRGMRADRPGSGVCSLRLRRDEMDHLSSALEDPARARAGERSTGGVR